MKAHLYQIHQPHILTKIITVLIFHSPQQKSSPQYNPTNISHHMSQKKPIKHWTIKQDLQYYLFLVIRYRQLLKRKKETKIYVEMARFIHLKNSTQCRTHHEKKLKELKRGNSKENVEVRNLRKFYDENYTIRRLKEDHLKVEIKLCLKEKRDEEIITNEEYEDYMERINEAMQRLSFEDSAEKARMDPLIPQANEGHIFQDESEATDLRDKESGEAVRMVPDFDFLDSGYEFYYVESPEY